MHGFLYCTTLVAVNGHPDPAFIKAGFIVISVGGDASGRYQGGSMTVESLPLKMGDDF